MIKHIFVLTTAAILAALALILLLLPTPTTSSVESQSGFNLSTENSFLIQQVTVFDGQQFHPNVDVRVTQGSITEVGQNIAVDADERVIEAQGLTLLPGLIDAHTHTFGAGLSDTLRFGVTTHLDMFSAESALPATRAKREQTAATAEADLFSSGTMATVEDGHGTQYGMSIDTITDISGIAQWVVNRQNAGADYIKLVYMPNQNYMPSLTLPQAQEVIKQAQAKGMLALAHISTRAAAEDMIAAGIDGLVHIFADQLADQQLVELARQRGIFIIPTLAVIASVDNQQFNLQLAENPLVKPRLSAAQRGTLTQSFGSSSPDFNYPIAAQNVNLFNQAGVPILAGSDAPNAGTAYGVSTHHEIHLLQQAGLTASQALSAATSLPAKHFKLQQRGAIAEGQRADLILVSADPREDITATLNIKQVFKNGFAVSFAPAADKQGRRISSHLLGNFDQQDSLKTIAGFNWTHSDDQLAKGKSAAQISMLTPGAEKTRGALYVTGNVNAGFPYPWAGAAVGDFTAPIEGVDISSFSKLTFWVKGTPGQYRVMTFDTVTQGIPPSQPFTVTEQWQLVEIELAQFNGFSPAVFSGFAFVAGPTFGEFEFSLDNVQLE